MVALSVNDDIAMVVCSYDLIGDQEMERPSALYITEGEVFELFLHRWAQD